MTMTITLIVDYKLSGRLVERHQRHSKIVCDLPLTWLFGIPPTPPPLQLFNTQTNVIWYFSSLADDIWLFIPEPRTVILMCCDTPTSACLLTRHAGKWIMASREYIEWRWRRVELVTISVWKFNVVIFILHQGATPNSTSFHALPFHSVRITAATA